MIRLTQDRLKDVLAYLEADLVNCLYLYGDIVRYGLDDPNMTVWFAERGGKINAVVMKYFSGSQVYSKDLDYDLDELVGQLRSFSPDRIHSQREIIEALTPVLQKDYTTEFGYIFKISNYRHVKSTVQIERAAPEDAGAIADLMLSNDVWAKMYEREALAKELADRMETGIGRSYIIRDGDRIVAHNGVSLETDKYMIESLAVLHDDYRNTFYGLFIESFMLNDVREEGKDLYNFIIEGNRADGFMKMGNIVCGHYGKMCKRSLKEVNS